VQQRQELVYFDRYAGELKTESIYGEKPLRWAYGTIIGRFCLETTIKQRWFSRLYGRWADCTCSSREILPFIEQFEIDTKDFLETPESYQTFNEFFYRRLKPEARPVYQDDGTACFPADGRQLVIPNLERATHIYAKNQQFDLISLLGDKSLAEKFAGGSAVISRLCPTDYHRFHFPLSGMPGAACLINGPLYSVNPIALSHTFSYLWQNKRRITQVKESPAGDYLILEIGATNVGSIVDSGSATLVTNGDEKGFFKFGGSMVITMFQAGRFTPAADLAEHSASGVELYARFGDFMGKIS
jgi:phosphatidylserine decarboxylase